jgi:hypothetical protein
MLNVTNVVSTSQLRAIIMLLVTVKVKMAGHGSRAVWDMSSDAGIMSSNPTQGVDVWCVCVYSVFVLSCVYVAALQRADHSSKESYRLWKMITELNKRPGPWMGWKGHWKMVKVKLSLCLTNWALHHEGVWWSRCIDPHFLDLGTSWRWVVIFTPRPLYAQGKSLWYPLDRRLGRPQGRSERSGEKKILDPTGTRTPM